MKVSECMTQDVRIVDPGETLQDAARTMAEIDAGFLPVGKNDRLVGIITDRDIAIRAVATGRSSNAKIGDVMSQEVRYCYADDTVEDILDNMAQQQLRRLPVVDRDKRLVGIVSITDLATNGEAAHSGEALCEIARPSGLHSQAI
ncbi:MULTISPECIES: CBS domain-containing protein [unclassified Sphingobium]|jgi:CBS domain-containing protein|uniref:CBS domain-containing protein n=1 Tax=unclassified Sphingobium TaxID=2611147 RepID=UPI0005CBDF31|nr:MULTISPECIES: CBS domain-containing protein [unclassified Sphingobium]AJR26853.1 inosine-5-monophosphate dehydrogenase [Sphingobium sp. YBL2]QPI75496.1 CBS domain-containing protein [Sphingobium sp. Cam5-1]UZW57890.1 CBS domain-containing protein [Sphingobium sp. JS3065]